MFMRGMVFEKTRVPLLLWLSSVFVVVRGFAFSVGSAGQCDPLNVSWFGGQPPFQLLIIPPGGTIRNISIPSSAFDGDSQKGSHTVQALGLPRGTEFMLSMSDATGIFAGGTSGLLTVGASQSGLKCNITDPGTDFYFSLDSTLAQCSPYSFTHYVGALLPITILVHIPQGQSFVLRPPPVDSFTWITNITAGTPAAFSVYDAKNRIGGTSSTRVVQLTDDSSCLSLSPSATAGKESKPSGSSPQSSNSSPGSVKGLAVGISIGVLGLLGFSCLIGFCCYRQSRLHRSRSHGTSSFVDLIEEGNDIQTIPPHHHRGPPSLALSTASTSTMAEVSTVNQVRRGENTGSSRAPSVGHRSWYQPDPFLAMSPQSSSQPRSSKWYVQNQDTISTPVAPTSTTYSPDVIVHADLADCPIELPPQYSASRAPLPNLLAYPVQARVRDSV